MIEEPLRPPQTMECLTFLDIVRGKGMIQPMSRELMGYFAQLVFADLEEKEFAEIEEIKAHVPIAAIAAGRLEAFSPDTQFNSGQLLLIGLLTQSPGGAVMWAWTFHKLFEMKKEKITVSLLADFFPEGFPTEKGSHKVWESQKIGGSNLLDVEETWTKRPQAGVEAFRKKYGEDG